MIISRICCTAEGSRICRFCEGHIVDAENNGITLTSEQEAILLADVDQMPDINTWDPPVPLVLLEGMYRPYADRLPPLSGIDGDVQAPSNIIWLRNAHPENYLMSLAEAGVIDLALDNA